MASASNADQDGARRIKPFAGPTRIFDLPEAGGDILNQSDFFFAPARFRFLPRRALGARITASEGDHK
jgi:hypothetical protein